MKKFTFFLFLLLSFTLSAQTTVEIKHVDWSKNASIYEANIRQFSKEGTFKKFEDYLPELKKMNVGIIWLMPINPIGEKNRKRSLGSYYSVKDYKDINPEFGTKEDFKNLVDKIHELGMYVIIDWVANHTAWDHKWITTNPEFYTKDKERKMVSPFDWSDVADLNYDNKDLRSEMTDAMKYWVSDFGIDGFRCDVAGMVPLDFWNDVRASLDKIKPVFMLAEASEPELQEKAFDMTYGWQYKDLFNDIAQGKKTAKDLADYIKNDEEKKYNPDSYRMIFTSNHDENSWSGTEFERLGDAAETFLVLSNLLKGMPLCYSGQEAGFNKRLEFFERDPIVWKEHKFRELYTKLFALKKENKALWNGLSGGDLMILKADNDETVFAFSRKKDNKEILSVINLSPKSQKVYVHDNSILGTYKNIITGNSFQLEKNITLEMKPWEYQVWEK